MKHLDVGPIVARPPTTAPPALPIPHQSLFLSVCHSPEDPTPPFFEEVANKDKLYNMKAIEELHI